MCSIHLICETANVGYFYFLRSQFISSKHKRRIYWTNFNKTNSQCELSYTNLVGCWALCAIVTDNRHVNWLQTQVRRLKCDRLMNGSLNRCRIVSTAVDDATMKHTTIRKEVLQVEDVDTPVPSTLGRRSACVSFCDAIEAARCSVGAEWTKPDDMTMSATNSAAAAAAAAQQPYFRHSFIYLFIASHWNVMAMLFIGRCHMTIIRTTGGERNC